jgi:predicted cupin superfamily sugar epimerase
MLPTKAREWIDRLGLLPHPEGGFYRETYRAAEGIARDALPERFSGDRAFSTAILFLLTRDNFSALHRIRQDEVWHHYDGDTLTVHVIDGAGEYRPIRLGKDAASVPQAVVFAGALFGASVEPPGEYALVGCTVAPGFDFADFKMPPRADLLRDYARHAAIVERLTR